MMSFNWYLSKFATNEDLKRIYIKSRLQKINQRIEENLTDEVAKKGLELSCFCSFDLDEQYKKILKRCKDFDEDVNKWFNFIELYLTTCEIYERRLKDVYYIKG